MAIGAKLKNEEGNRMRRSPLSPGPLYPGRRRCRRRARCGAAGSGAAPPTSISRCLRIGANAPLPATRQIKLGLNKSMIVELPRAVRDVMVSNPEQIDAVMQTSTRAYLIGKRLGEANVFFTDKDGKQIVTLEVTIERDLVGAWRPSQSAHSRLQYQGSRRVGDRVVLTGTVDVPIDATRACEIADSFLGALDQAAAGSSRQRAAARPSPSTHVGEQRQRQRRQRHRRSCEATNVINMITVEGKEQVLLKVSVVEMERNIVKQFGIDLNALVNSGNFAFAALSDLPFPINAAGQGRSRAIPDQHRAGLAGNDAASRRTALEPDVGKARPGVGGVQWMTGRKPRPERAPRA